MKASAVLEFSLIASAALLEVSHNQSTESPLQSGENDWKKANPKNVQLVFHAGELRMTGE